MQIKSKDDNHYLLRCHYDKDTKRGKTESIGKADGLGQLDIYEGFALTIDEEKQWADFWSPFAQKKEKAQNQAAVDTLFASMARLENIINIDPELLSLDQIGQMMHGTTQLRKGLRNLQRRRLRAEQATEAEAAEKA